MTGNGWTEQSLITRAALSGSECDAQLLDSMGFMPTRGLDYPCLQFHVPLFACILLE